MSGQAFGIQRQKKASKMTSRLGQSARFGLLLLFILIAGLFAPVPGHSAPFAAFVMDARTGEVIHSQNADTRLHPEP